MSVIVPGIQRLLSDVIKNTVDGIIYGIRGIRPDRGNARNISYSSYYDRNTIGANSNIPTIPTSMYAKSNVYSVNDVIFYDRGEAEETLLRLRRNRTLRNGVRWRFLRLDIPKARIYGFEIWLEGFKRSGSRKSTRWLRYTIPKNNPIRVSIWKQQ